MPSKVAKQMHLCREERHKISFNANYNMHFICLGGGGVGRGGLYLRVVAMRDVAVWGLMPPHMPSSILHMLDIDQSLRSATNDGME